MAKVSRPYPPDWDTRRKKVYKRDDYTCCNCNRQGGPYGNLELHAHHIVPKSRGGTDAMSNLITACKPCHDAIHSKRGLAPTVAGFPGNDGPSVGERVGDKLRSAGARRLAVHACLLVLTAGIGNVVYYLHNRRGNET